MVIGESDIRFTRPANYSSLFGTPDCSGQLFDVVKPDSDEPLTRHGI